MSAVDASCCVQPRNFGSGWRICLRDRRMKRREFRRLWIIRISAACEQQGLRYSQFIHGLNLANIGLDRKQLSEMAIHDPAGFQAVVEQVKSALAAQQAA
jgi:large subunit ribosomal protein L20